MEALGRIILTTILSRFIKKHKLKIHLYKLILRMYVDQIYKIFCTKCSFYRIKFEEKTKTKILIHIKNKAEYYFGKCFVKFLRISLIKKLNNFKLNYKK